MKFCNESLSEQLKSIFDRQGRSISIKKCGKIINNYNKKYGELQQYCNDADQYFKIISMINNQPSFNDLSQRIRNLSFLASRVATLKTNIPLLKVIKSSSNYINIPETFEEIIQMYEDFSENYKSIIYELNFDKLNDLKQSISEFLEYKTTITSGLSYLFKEIKKTQNIVTFIEKCKIQSFGDLLVRLSQLRNNSLEYSLIKYLLIDDLEKQTTYEKLALALTSSDQDLREVAKRVNKESDEIQNWIDQTEEIA